MHTTDIIASAKELRTKHPNGMFNENYVKVTNLQLIARRFTEHKRTNVAAIKNIEKAVQYMIAARMVGDRRLIREMSDLTDGVLDSYCEHIEVVDDCCDGFDRAVDRHLYHHHPGVYELLTSKKIKFLDAGIVHGGRDIFLPAYNTMINVVRNRRCLEELDEFIKNTPEEDKHNNQNIFTRYAVKKFIVYEGHLYVSNKDSDPVDLKDSLVEEYIVDSQLDPDNIYPGKFEKLGNAGGNGSITMHRSVPLRNLHNYDEIVVRNGIVYHDETNHIYVITGHYELMHLLKYDELNSMSLIYSYLGQHKIEYVDKIKLGNLARYYSPIKLSEYEDEHGEGSLRDNYIYLFKGRSKLAKVPYKSGDYSRELDFNLIQELLDKVK